MKKAMKNFMVMVMVMVLVAGAMTMARPELLKVFEESKVEEATVEVEVKEKEKKELEKVILEMTNDRTFVRYTIMYKDSWTTADSIMNLVDILNEDTNDTYLISETGKVMKVVEKKAYVIEIEKQVNV